jgi:hypothetical protein
MTDDKYPKYEATPDVINYFKTDNTAEIIKKLSKAKLKQKLKDYEKTGVVKIDAEREKVYYDRLEYELKVIEDKKVLDYFMVVWELIRFCKENGVSSGVGRGSAAGCLLSWCLDITKIDPVRFDLYFERFLNPERKCLTEDNFVLMADGSYKIITEINENDIVQTKNGVSRVLELVQRDIEDKDIIFEIETEEGAKVRITNNHIIPVLRDGKFIQIKAEEIISSDLLFTF